MKQNLKIIIFFLITSSFIASAYQKELNDSIQNIVNSSSSDSVKAKLLIGMARNMELSQRVDAMQIYKLALSYTKDTQRRGELQDTIGLYNWHLGNFDEALNYFKQALAVFEKTNDSIWLGKIHNNIAVVTWGLGNSIEALKNYQAALIFRKANNDKAGVARVMNNMGIIYQDWGLYNEAFKWHREALKTAFEIQDDNVIAYSYANIGTCYERENELDSALINYQIGYRHLLRWDEINKPNSFISVNIGEVYQKMNKPDSALIYFREALNFGKRVNSQNRIAIANYNIGKTYLSVNNLDSAKFFINQSYTMCIEKNYNITERDNLYVLSEIAERENNIAQAFDYFKKASALKDSLFNRDKIARFTDLQIEHFTEQQKQENLILRKNNEIQRITIRQQRFLAGGLIAGSMLVIIVLINMSIRRKALKKLNAKLEQSEKELLKVNADKDKFFTIIAHDLKSPFNGLIGITDLLATDFDYLPRENIKSMILALKESTTNIYQLLEGLLEWSQIQTGKIKYHFEKFLLKNSVEKIVDLFSTNASNKNISLEINIDESLEVYADARTTSAIIRNLLSNAIKFTTSGGKITIAAREKKDIVEIWVSDTGIGMKQEIIDKLFNIGEKISERGTAKETGTGLGLILCKEFAEKNNGKIRVESTPGKGSKFTFTLPKLNSPILKKTSPIAERLL